MSFGKRVDTPFVYFGYFLALNKDTKEKSIRKSPECCCLVTRRRKESYKLSSGLVCPFGRRIGVPDTTTEEARP